MKILLTLSLLMCVFSTAGAQTLSGPIDCKFLENGVVVKEESSNKVISHQVEDVYILAKNIYGSIFIMAKTGSVIVSSEGVKTGNLEVNFEGKTVFVQCSFPKR